MREIYERNLLRERCFREMYERGVFERCRREMCERDVSERCI